jgi:translin
MPTLRTVLNAIKKDLQHKYKIRENAQKDMRQATSLSKQAILLTHQKRWKEAENLIAEAKETFAQLRKTSETHPDIIYTGMFNDALQEYSEANIFLTLIKKSKFLTPEEINVPPADYVLGLADVVGEYRRFALDELREGNVKKAESCLRLMDEIYVELMALDESYMLVHGLRRKNDVGRKIIEATRGDVTQEICRSKLEKQLKQLEKRITEK